MEDKILVNDIITIDKERCDESYSSLYDWFKSYGISTDNYGKRLSNHIEDDGVDEKYRCIWVAPVPSGEIVYAIQGMDTKKIFLVEEEAILQYSHTLHSFDSTEQALDILTRNYHKLILEFKNYKESIEKNNNAAPDNSNDIPELEDGMFGIAKHLKTDKIDAFYVRKDTIIYESGGWDFHSIFDKTGKSGYTQILALYNSDTQSFKRVKALYYDINIPNPSKLIWKKID